MPPTSYEMDAIRAVEAYGSRVLQQASAGSAQTRTLAHWTVMHLHKRALSSPEALRCSLRNRRERLRQRLAEMDYGLRSPDPRQMQTRPTDAAIAPEVARANVLDEDTGERLTDEEAGQRTERVVYGSPQQIQAELALLEAVLDKARQGHRRAATASCKSCWTPCSASDWPPIPRWSSLPATWTR